MLNGHIVAADPAVEAVNGQTGGGKPVQRVVVSR